MIYKTEFGFCKIYKDLTCEWYPNIEMHFWTYFPHLILTTSRIDILQKLSNSRPKSLSNVQIKLFCPVQIICVTWVCDLGTHQLTSWSWWNIHGITPANSSEKSWPSYSPNLKECFVSVVQDSCYSWIYQIIHYIIFCAFITFLNSEKFH